MANPYFSFKQFTVYHDKCAMKVGIDGVLLGAWTDVENSNAILDIGTGTGLIALMLAQRGNGTVEAIDIDPNAVLQAKENITNSPWADRIHVHETSLQQFAENSTKRYDLIVSNPPYFVNSTKAPAENRSAARHTDTLSHEELIRNARILLKRTGRISIILPVIEGIKCIEYALQLGLYCTKHVTVFPKPTAAAKRLLLEFSLIPVQNNASELTIEALERHCYSTEFTALAKNFYLKL
jgi:tRNA1Val (adenine37-N6)-methyltransferase